MHFLMIITITLSTKNLCSSDSNKQATREKRYSESSLSTSSTESLSVWTEQKIERLQNKNYSLLAKVSRIDPSKTRIFMGLSPHHHDFFGPQDVAHYARLAQLYSTRIEVMQRFIQEHHASLRKATPT